MAKDALGHGSNARGGNTAAERPGRVRGMPIAGHDYHTKTNAELKGIAAVLRIAIIGLPLEEPSRPGDPLARSVRPAI